MVLVVKATNYKKIFAKVISFGIVGAMLVWYYFETEKKMVDIQNSEMNKTMISKEEKRAKTLEKIFLNEAEVCVELLNQAKVQSILVVEEKMVIVCDVDVDIEPLMIRYGANALVKNTNENVKIAVDLSYIAENKYEES